MKNPRVITAALMVALSAGGLACRNPTLQLSGTGGKSPSSDGGGGAMPRTDGSADTADGGGGVLGGGSGGIGAGGGTGGAGGVLAATGGAGGGVITGTGGAGGGVISGTGGAGAGGAGMGTGGVGMGGALGTGGNVDVGWQVLSPPLTRKVDILFMIDNSQSMQPLQDKLIASFPVFMNVLKALPMGLPDLHVGVVSSDTGAGAFDMPDRHCPYGGDQGQLQSQPRGTCTTSPLNAGATFLQAANNQQQKNYTGDITDAFACIARLGDQGCGFEGQLKSVRLALDPAGAPVQNQGFLRSEAYLSIVLITNEDDCSVPDDSTMMDPAQELMSDPLGPLWSFRCNEFGHLCNINGTLQPPPRGAATNLTGCVSNDTATGKLTKLRDEVAFLKSLKPDPNQLLVSAVTGPAEPYGIEMQSRTTSHGITEEQPNTKHSCTLASGEYADPSIRIKQWVEAFGANGLLLPICASSLAPAMQIIANKIAGVFGPACVSGPFPPAPAGGQPACRVVDRTTGADGGRSEVLLPNCADDGNVAPCWSLMDDTAGCLDGKRLVLNRGTTTPPPSLTTAFTCRPCQAGEIGCP